MTRNDAGKPFRQMVACTKEDVGLIMTWKKKKNESIHGMLYSVGRKYASKIV